MTAQVPSLIPALPAWRPARRGMLPTERWCAAYRKALRGAAVSFPATVLQLEDSADWVRRRGVCLDVHDPAELDVALSSNVQPRRLIAHAAGWSPGDLPRLVETGPGRVVVNARWQVGILAAEARRRQFVLVEPTGDEAHDAQMLRRIVASAGRLDLIGVHRRLQPGEAAAATVHAAMGQMAELTRRYGVLPVRLSLADVDVANWGCPSGDLEAVHRVVDDAVESACISYRLPRPAISLSPSRAAVLSATHIPNWVRRTVATASAGPVSSTRAAS